MRLGILAAATALSLAACATPAPYEAHLARVEVRKVNHCSPAAPCESPCVSADPCSAPPQAPARRLITSSGSGPRVLWCNEGGCLANVTGSGPVMIRCGAGGCDVNATGSGPRLLVCPGGSCSMRCSGSGACAIVGCGSSCSMQCSGSGACAQRRGFGLLGVLR
ncbi:MAG: hypothetical protein KC503_46505 [Myxococcales bacterium]|nr:hypothetical protein [Myxococcales bacterium]